MKHFLFLFFIPFLLNAQESIIPLITDRPDQTESSVTVPLNSLQIETGVLLENNKTGFSEQKSFVYNSTLLRYGLGKNLELRLGFEYLGEENKSLNSDSSNTISGFGPLNAGFKFKITEEEDWKPEIALIGAIDLPFTASSYFKPNYTALNFVFCFSHSISEKITVAYNLGTTLEGIKSISEYIYSFSINCGLTERVGTFIESYASFSSAHSPAHMLDGGITYLFWPQLQLDVYGGVGINKQAPDRFVGAGFSYRLPE
ncbi:transporter [Caldithrix abyssi]